MLWQSDGGGRGYASLAIAANKVFTLGDASSVEYLHVFDASRGDRLWRLKVGPAWNDGRNPTWQSSRSTPTVDATRAYVLTGHGDLVCADFASEAEIWRKNLKTDFRGNKGDSWGYSESVLVDSDRLICTPGGETNTMVALDKKTGELVWHTTRPGDHGAGHASIVVSKIGPTRVYVQQTASGPMGVRASDGKLLWTFDFAGKITAVIPTLIVRDDLVFSSTGYSGGGMLLRQVPASEGEMKIEEVYPLNKELASKHGGLVLVGDYLYGGLQDSNVVFCADLMTGEIKWKARGSGQGSAAIAAADGCLYIHFANGTMSLVKASPDKYEELGSFTVPGSGERPSWAHPVVIGGRLYLREQDRIVCYDVRADKQ